MSIAPGELVQPISVETTTLREAATTVGNAADRVRDGDSTRVPSPVGHPALTSAVSAFATRLDASWGAHSSATDAVENGLRGTARAYESGDGDAQLAMKPRGGT